MTGWVSITRASASHPIFRRSEVSEYEAWVRIVQRAAWEETRHLVGGELLKVERGSFFCSLRELQSEFMWKSDKRVRNFLKKLEKQEMLTLKTDAGGARNRTHVTICNYDEYQRGGRSTDASGTQHGRSTDALKKQENNITSKQEREDSAPARPSTPKLFDLFPAFISPELAKQFVEHRRAKRSPMTAKAVSLLGKSLTEIRDAGLDAEAALEMAIERGWQTVKLEWAQRELSTPKTNGGSNGRNYHEDRQAVEQSRVDRLLEIGKRRDAANGEAGNANSSHPGVAIGAGDNASRALSDRRYG